MIYSLGALVSYIMGYKLAVVPKVKRALEYSSAYGSQHDFKHIHACIKKEIFNIDIQYQIIYENSFFKSWEKFDGVIFLGLSGRSIEFISDKRSLDVYVWAFNQCVWQQSPSVYDNVSIVFEQSTKDMQKFSQSSTDVYFLPLAFQEDRFRAKYYKPECDLVFNGTLFRNRRAASRDHRVDLIELLLKKGINIVNYNGRSKKRDEAQLLERLKKYENFKVKNVFGEAKHYQKGVYSLDLPFLDTETGDDNEKKYGMTWHDLENTIWLNHWDIFRAIGSKANIITFDAPEVRGLGLNENNVHFYKSTPENLSSLADEIEEIIQKKKIKTIGKSVWDSNTYQNRWGFIISKICSKVGVPHKNQRHLI